MGNYRCLSSIGALLIRTSTNQRGICQCLSSNVTPLSFRSTRQCYTCQCLYSVTR